LRKKFRGHVDFTSSSSSPELKGATTMTNGKTRNVALWIVQGLLAAVFLMAGGSKLVLPPEALKGPVALPIGFLRFIGVAEVLGAAGLILPGLFRIRPGLTPLAALGLTVIMIGATAITVAGGAIAPALIPATVGVLTTLVALGRRRRLEGAARARSSLLEGTAQSPVNA
jgi:uncharacterized membrane protein YphA (DoxX/SURF4 family)